MVGCLIGVSVAFAAWIALVPWDLSERADGSRSGDDFGPEIAAVCIVVTIVGVLVAIAPRTRPLAAALAAGGLWCWTALFAWRAGTAEMVSGANLYMIPLLFLFVPSAIVLPIVGHGVVRRCERTAHTAPHRRSGF